MRPGVYRYAGVEFTVDSAEVTRLSTSRGITPAEAAKELCIKQGVGHLTVEQVRPLSGGGYEYKIGGEWVSSSTPTTPSTPEHIKTMFETEMAKQGRAFDFAKFASEAKALKFAASRKDSWSRAVAVIMHLKVEDKRKAV
jgi:hypothetical protein